MPVSYSSCRSSSLSDSFATFRQAPKKWPNAVQKMNILAACTFFTSCSLLVATAHAQTTFSFGLKGGLTGAKAHYQDSPNTLTGKASYRLGFEAGVQGVLSWNHWQFQPALLYRRNSFHLAGTQTDVIGTDGVTPAPYEEDIRLSYLTVPVMLAYAQQGNGQGLQVFAGPYLSVLVGGHFRFWRPSTAAIVSVEGPVKGGARPASSFFNFVNYSQRVDAGLQAGLGYRYKQALLQATYSVGLRNLTSENSSSYIGFGPNYKNRVFQVSLAYLFQSKSKT
jgi:hypothetical protein